ncbi:MAG TPA: hypothetical protein VF506_03585 [Streptosporangiaceae bacterium]
MRKYLYLAATVAASAAVVALPATSASAAGHVLTIKKTGGTAVKKGAVLKAGLVTGTSAVFSLGSQKLTCKVAKFSAKVTSNPVKPGTAKESVTAQSFSKCTVNVSGITVKSIKVKNLPFKATVSDGKGFPVKITGQSKTKPIEVTATVAAGTTTVSCSYKAGTVSGTASNTGNKITFTKQKFTRIGTNALCPASANFAAAFGPVVDSSVTGSPKVFVN